MARKRIGDLEAKMIEPLVIKQDKFDYTECRKTLLEDKSLEEICRKGDVFSRQLRGEHREGV